jgi:phage-related tail fiber protein
MRDRIVTDMLAAHADRLVGGRDEPAVSPGVSAEQLASLESLMQLAERTQRTLAPVQPSPTFVHQLGRQLIVTTSASRKAVTRRTRSAILVIAAALGSAVSIASAVGIVIYVIRHRGRVRPGRAISESAVR